MMTGRFLMPSTIFLMMMMRNKPGFILRQPETTAA